METVKDVAGYENVKYDLRMLPVNQIELPEHALRPAQTEEPEFLRLMDSVKTHGYFSNILVKELDSSTAEAPRYGVIDGTQRFTIAKMLGLSEIPCRVVAMDEAEVAEAQIIANAVRVTTTPVQFTIQLRRILNSNPTMTRQELAQTLNMSVKWLDDRLSLGNLSEPAKKLTDDGAIRLSHAFALAKLQPPEEQDTFLQEAQTDSLPEFSGKVEARIKEIRAAVRAGRSVGERQFVAVPHLRKLGDFKAIYEGDETLVDQIIARENPDSLRAAVLATFKWIAQVDAASIEEKKKKDEQIKLQREIANAKKAEEQAKIRADKALEAANAMQTVNA